MILLLFDQKILDETLEYLEKSIAGLAMEARESLEMENMERLKSFLEDQFDIRLENLLVAKNTSVHHLESGMKNRVIQRKRQILDDILDR